MTRVSALYRLSSAKQVKEQRKDNVDVPGQKAAVARFVAEREGWQLVKEYTEPGVSAFKKRYDERPVLQQALQDAKDGLFDVLCVFREDRLSRGDAEGGAELIVILAMFRASGVQVWSVGDNKLLSLDDAQVIIRAAEGYSANQEVRKTGQRVQNGMRTGAEAGRWMGGRVPFGYRLEVEMGEDGQPVMRGSKFVRRLVPSEEWAPVVREMYARYLAGQGTPQLAAWLNSVGAPSFSGKGWDGNGVMHMLSNPMYMGIIAYHKSWRSRKHGADSFTRQGTHAAIIDVATFETAQAHREARKRVPSRQLGSVYALGGVAYCECGARMGGIARARDTADGVRVDKQQYRCRAKVMQGVCPCGMKHVDADEVEQNFLAAIEALQHPASLRGHIEQRHNANNTRRQDALTARRLQQEELQRTTRAMDKLDREFFEGDTIERSDYKRLKTQYSVRKEELEAALLEPLPVDSAVDTDGLVEIARQVRRLWMEHGTPAERQAFALDFTTSWGLRVVVHADATVTLDLQGELAVAQ